MVTIVLLYLGIGAITGILSGLLGVGGGLVLVPMISYSLHFQGLGGEHSHHIALGTSLSIVMFTSISSFLAHNKNKAVLWHIVRSLSGGILVGTYLGTLFAVVIPTMYLKFFFIVFLYYVGIQMVFNLSVKTAKNTPGFIGNSFAGGAIGFISSLVGIGGGTLTIPYLTWCSIPMHKAIGTSAAVGFPIAIAGAAGYIINGWSNTEIIPHSLGYVYLPALICIAIASVCFAPLGAALSHKLPVSNLKKIFACLVFIIATQMLYSMLF